MSILVEIAPDVYHLEEVYITDIVILKFQSTGTEVYIQYNVEDNMYQISCITDEQEDHTVFEF